jgi:hypothetical protein
MMEERVSKEAKLNAAKDIVASYLRGANTPALTGEDVCQLFKKVYDTIEDVVPEGQPRRVGLGL